MIDKETCEWFACGLCSANHCADCEEWVKYFESQNKQKQNDHEES